MLGVTARTARRHTDSEVVGEAQREQVGVHLAGLVGLAQTAHVIVIGPQVDMVAELVEGAHAQQGTDDMDDRPRATAPLTRESMPPYAAARRLCSPTMMTPASTSADPATCDMDRRSCRNT